MDRVPLEVRSRIMAAIGPKDTGPELLVRRALHARGFRFRLHDRQLPGRPDIVLPKYRAVIEVRGCFWHGHRCYLFRMPGTNTEFWRAKIDGTVARDRQNVKTLLSAKWRVAIIWECAIRGVAHRESLSDVIGTLEAWLHGEDAYVEILGGSSDSDEVSYSLEADGIIAAEPLRTYRSSRTDDLK